MILSLPADEQLTALTVRHAVPTVYQTRICRGRRLDSYGSRLTDAYRLIGVYTGRVLKGEKPADLPMVQSTKFEFVDQRQAAKSLGLHLAAVS